MGITGAAVDLTGQALSVLCTSSATGPTRLAAGDTIRAPYYAECGKGSGDKRPVGRSLTVFSASAAVFFATRPALGKPDVAKLGSSPEHIEPLPAAAPGSVVSRQGFLQNRFVQFRFRQQLLQPLVLRLQLLQSTSFL